MSTDKPVDQLVDSFAAMSEQFTEDICNLENEMAPTYENLEMWSDILDHMDDLMGVLQKKMVSSSVLLFHSDIIESMNAILRFSFLNEPLPAEGPEQNVDFFTGFQTFLESQLPDIKEDISAASSDQDGPPGGICTMFLSTLYNVLFHFRSH